MKKTLMSINSWLDQQIVLFLCSGILFNNKEALTINTHDSINESKIIRLSERRHKMEHTTGFSFYKIPKNVNNL